MYIRSDLMEKQAVNTCFTDYYMHVDYNNAV